MSKDPEGNVVTLSLVSGPSYVTLDPTTGIVTLSPQYFDSNTTSNATIRVSDSAMT